MPKIEYVPRRFAPSSIQVIDQANTIITDYQADGYTLTLRQLYYQFVSRAWLPNTQKNYDRLGSIINDARLAGCVDWEAIEDRTRNLERLPHWDSPEDIVQMAASQFRIDKWDPEFQSHRVEVWVEKEALIGVFEGVCDEWQVPYFACRGYVSQSEMWRAAERMKGYDNRQHTLILHFGDHDPSGVDMTRDIQKRLNLFGAETEVKRIALNMDQIQQYDPPPNPAKITDSRAADYIKKFGRSSWELDALEPRILIQLVRDNVESVRDDKAWIRSEDIEESRREELSAAADDWAGVVNYLGVES